MATQNINMISENSNTDSAPSLSQFNQGVDALKEQLKDYAVDDDTLRSQAEAQYRPAYESELDALRQQLAQQTQSLNHQLSALGDSYARERRDTQQNYDESAARLDNALAKRGLGRSSLVSTQGGYLENKRNQALADIDASESGAINAINERIALLTQQAAQSERSMAANYARQLDQRVNELRDKNRSAALNLQLQIAALQQQGYEAYQKWLAESREQALKEKELEVKYGLNTQKTSSGSSGGSKKPSSNSSFSKAPSSSSSVKSSVKKADSSSSGQNKSLASSLKDALTPAAQALKNLLTKASGTASKKSTGASTTSSVRPNLNKATKTHL